MVDFTTQLLIFDSIVILGIIGITMYLFFKSKELYSLSLQKGIMYFRNAMFFYLLSFGIRYITSIFDFFDGQYGNYMFTLSGLILAGVNIFFAILGGFYLGYCLFWRDFESDSIRRIHHIKFYIVALLITLTDIFMMYKFNLRTPFFFFGIVILFLVWGITKNCIQCRGKTTSDMNPFYSLVGLGLGVYIAFFIENLLDMVFFTIHYYTWGIALVFTIAFVYNFVKLAK